MDIEVRSIPSPLNSINGKKALLQGRKVLREQFSKNANSTALLRGHSRLVDVLLRQVWKEMALPGSITLLAVGGYGRGYLFPRSDIDLLVLLPAKGNSQYAVDAATKLKLERWVHLLWDMGLEVGHSVRTLTECTEESEKDITVQTSLLEARRLAGSRKLFSMFSQAMKAELNPREFFNAKQFEQQQRHGRYHDVTYNLEPNLKESPGGLRDLQNILWVSRATGYGRSWSDLIRGGFITREEARLTKRHEKILQGLRIRLHFLAGRREDRLLFDYQTLLAKEYKIADKPPRRAGELLMQRYYRAAKSVTQINTILLLTLRAEIFPDTNVTPVILNKYFQKRGELLEIRDKNIFRKEPSVILESVLMLQQHPELKARSVATLRALWHSTSLINSAFRLNLRNCNLFIKILRQPRGLTRELRFMSRYGILGRYIPVFGRIIGQMQHDLFHVYTVDEHILMVVRNLRRFMASEFAHEYPLCSQLISEFDRPEILYLAGLFHDIAKGRNGDHSLLGRKDAKRFCTQHGLPAEDTELVTWLVENHLIMSATAQKKDLSDPEVISGFATHVRNERRLIAIYLLTVADIRGTSPKVWNTWKGKLLEDLFWATWRYLCGEPAYAGGTLENRKIRVLELLQLDSIPTDAHKQLWSELDTTYFLQNDPQEIAWHTRQLYNKVNSPVPVVKARTVPAGEGVQVIIYTADQKDLFSRICSFFEHINYSIVEAKIHTTKNGYALDSFLVLNPFKSVEQYRDVIHVVEHGLRQQLEQQLPLKPPSQVRLSRHLKHFPITPEVDIEPDEKGAYHVLSIIAGDQPELLSRVAQVLAGSDVRVHSAKVNTMGERAEDIFLITGRILNETKTLISLEAKLLRILQTPDKLTQVKSG
ncbi:MAG: [protein-PII] uridylyltransferase [Nitrosomonadaceae bacterium]